MHQQLWISICDKKHIFFALENVFCKCKQNSPYNKIIKKKLDLKLALLLNRTSAHDWL